MTGRLSPGSARARGGADGSVLDGAGRGCLAERLAIGAGQLDNQQRRPTPLAGLDLDARDQGRLGEIDHDP